MTGKPATPAKPAKAAKVKAEKAPKAAAETGERGNGLTALARPYLEFIDKGKLFGLVYTVMAIANVLLPFAVLYMVIDSGLLKYADGKLVAAFIFTWLVIAFACWVGFQIWWDRRKKMTTPATSQFSATVVFSEIVQTTGEWMGTMYAIIGAGVGLITTIFLESSGGSLLRALGMNFLSSGIMSIIIAPITGFFIIVGSRFLAEQLRIFAALANNTKEIADNIKGKGPRDSAKVESDVNKLGRLDGI
jgi:hypothetical protein